MGAPLPRDHEADTRYSSCSSIPSPVQEQATGQAPLALVKKYLASLSKNAPKIDCTLSHASLQLHIRHLRSWGGKEEREDKERRKLAGTWGKERRILQE